MPIIPVRLIPGELANEVDWNNHSDVMEELQAGALLTSFSNVPYTTPWVTDASANEVLAVRWNAVQAFMRGIVKNTAATADPTIIGTVPLGSRPTETVRGFVDRATGAGGIFGERRRVDINPNGQISLYGTQPIDQVYFMKLEWSLG